MGPSDLFKISESLEYGLKKIRKNPHLPRASMGPPIHPQTFDFFKRHFSSFVDFLGSLRELNNQICQSCLKENLLSRKGKISSMSHHGHSLGGRIPKKNLKMVCVINVGNLKNDNACVLKGQKCYLGKNTKKK